MFFLFVLFLLFLAIMYQCRVFYLFCFIDLIYRFHTISRNLLMNSFNKKNTYYFLGLIGGKSPTVILNRRIFGLS